MEKYRLILQSWGVDENGTHTYTTTTMEGDELPIKAAYYSTRMDLMKDFEGEVERKGEEDYLFASELANVKIKMEKYEEE